MEENDLEAISALNALSHSPGGAFSKIGTTGERSSKAQTRDDKTKEQLSTTTTSSKRALPFITAESEHTSGAEGENKGSFFSKVVGGIRERVSKKRKLSY